jgi:hypothetical protein
MGEGEGEIPFPGPVSPLTTSARLSEIGQTPQFCQAPDTARRGYYRILVGVEGKDS